jgi:hypothetical protein
MVPYLEAVIAAERERLDEQYAQVVESNREWMRMVTEKARQDRIDPDLRESIEREAERFWKDTAPSLEADRKALDALLAQVLDDDREWMRLVTEYVRQDQERLDAMWKSVRQEAQATDHDPPRN